MAAGKGGIIPEDREEAQRVIRDMLSGESFGSAGKRVVIEEFMDGIECSMFAVTDGKAYHLLPSAKDYQRIGEGDTGPNTGGMGAVSPVPFMDAEFHEKAINQIIIPTVKGLAADGILYNGFLFWLMKVGGDLRGGVQLPLGDPKPRSSCRASKATSCTSLKTWGRLLSSTTCGSPACTTVMLVSEGYPGAYKKGKTISVRSDSKKMPCFSTPEPPRPEGTR